MFWTIVWAAVTIMAFRYALRAALVADSRERNRAKDFSTAIEDWLHGGTHGDVS